MSEEHGESKSPQSAYAARKDLAERSTAEQQTGTCSTPMVKSQDVLN